MSTQLFQRISIAGLMIAIGAAGGYWFATQQSTASAMSTTMSAAGDKAEKPVLYWYDPMFPQQKFDEPGKSPFMDMQLVPRYGGDDADAASISIDSSITQNLGMRLTTVTSGKLVREIHAAGKLSLNNRDLAIVQARSAGFVERVYNHAEEDVVEKGQPLADILVPDWVRAQEDYLALRSNADRGLVAAAKQRMLLSGMPAALIAQVQRSGKTQPIWTVTSPISGVLEQLQVRQGMSVSNGMTLAQINGLSRVWLDIAIPEVQAADLAVGQAIEANLPGAADRPINGRISAILPQADVQSRTVQIRVELNNPQGKLRPGQTAHVRLTQQSAQTALLLPTEAVIRSGRRAIVMLAKEDGRYQPVEVKLGQESSDQVEITQGLQAGQQVVISGQFLLDSEASLRGIAIQALDGSTTMPASTALHEAEGKIVSLSENSLTLAHGPFKTLSMTGMTMQFPVANTALLKNLKKGDKVRVGVSEGDSGLLIERIEPLSTAMPESMETRP